MNQMAAAGNDMLDQPVGLTLPGAASLVEQLDKRLLVVLRDGRHLVGTMRSFDQFSNMVLEGTVERHIAKGLKFDLPLGLYIVRGDNVVVLGELDPVKEKALNLKDADEVTVRTAEKQIKGVEWDFEKIERF
eukprot:CAMPEP_0114337992 /NCGR_PEP_ID=MMETSP0101-20121206/6744_1 /TAXON_ID=38822 ORGANISM="Pteridomonas danica, Strain PT" /NCGR_SAMPLE_ID=MMETSP0101 /ASSEMBLY_ACC=CAM_ASM_000211 /LENGTH=131 /DNA_ID=CAMNT_0001470435 /DNA_START=6 /DNA_END=401 /DNA_ORIENTATION=-